MQDFPHHYHASTRADAAGDIILASPPLDTLRTASPAEFGGPGDRWSPETLLTGAVGDCFALTFRAVARASRLPWTSLRCDVTGTLDRLGSVPQFTGFDLVAHLDVPEGTSIEQAQKALEKAERHCLVSNSLKGEVHLHTCVEVERSSPAFG
jgi:organic hydroperoxide reductase OsmC/OhrA